MEHGQTSRLKLAVLLFGVFATSFGVLALEISLTRIFSILLDYHYTFLVVSLAIFGLGLGGIIAQYLTKKATSSSIFSRLAAAALIFSVTAIGFTFVIVSVPNLSTAAQVFLTFVPFLVAGALLATAYKMFVSQSGVLHFVDLAGAAGGSLLVVFLIAWAGAVQAILLVSIVTLVSSLLFALASKRKIVIVIASLVVVGIALLAQSSGLAAWNIQPASDQGKELDAYLSNLEGAEIVDTRWSAFGQVDVVASPVEPHQKIIFVDGGAGTALYHFDGDFNSSQTLVGGLRSSTQYFPYTFTNKGNALVIGPGGGVDVLTALMGGVNHIYAIEVNPSIVDIVEDYESYAGGIYTNYSNVHVSVDEGRSFLKRSNQVYDTIMLDLPVSKTSQGTFGYALSENYLFTTDSFKDYLNHLSDEGFLAVVAHNQAEVYKLVSTAYKMLQDEGLYPAQIMQRMAVVGSNDHNNHDALPVFLLKKTPISSTQAMQISNSAAQLGLATLYTPLSTESSMDTRLAHLALDSMSIDELVAAAPFNMKAATDDSPFFYNFDLGIPSVLAPLLGGSIVVAVVVTLLYMIARRRQEENFKDGVRVVLKTKFSMYKWFCFASLGLGFMLIEVALTQKFILYLGEPTVAIAASLFTLLIAGGVGSLLSRKWVNGKQINAFKASLVTAIMVVAYVFTLPFIFNATLNLPTLQRFAISFSLIFPLGFLMGIPFPTLLGYIKKESENDSAWMWCINGGFSVLAGIMAIVIAMGAGFNTVLFLGAATYAALFFVGRSYENSHKPRSVRWINPRKRVFRGTR